MSTKVQTHPLISVRADATVQEAARLMADCSIGALGVLDADGQFQGIVTERDLSWFVAQAKDAVVTRVGEIVNDFRIVSMRDLFVMGSADNQELTARDVMTAPAVACRGEAFFEEVAEMLADRDISGMPVVDASDRVIGVISERDLAHVLGGPMVRLAVRRRNHGPFMRDLRDLQREIRHAKDVMTSPAVTVGLDAHLDEIARLMRVHKINRVPVVDSDRLVGVVTRGDVLGAIAHLDHHTVIDFTQPPVVVGSAGMSPGRQSIGRGERR